MTPKPFILSALLMFAAATLQAVEVAGDRYPERVEALDADWKLQGAHHFKYKIFFSVFTGALYEQVGGDGQRLTFTYTRSLDADDLRKQAMETLRNAHDEATLKKYEDLTRAIQNAYKDVDDGDNYTLTVLPDRGVWLHRNGEEAYFADNAEFGFWYLSIWLGDQPASNSLKRALTGEDT